MKTSLLISLPMLLAIAEPSAADQGRILVTIFWVIGIATGVLVFLNQARALFGKKPPIDEQFAAVQAKLADEVKGIRTKLDEIDRRRSTAIAGVHHELDDHIAATARTLREQAVALAGVEKEAETHTRQLAAMQSSIERILEKLPRTTTPR